MKHAECNAKIETFRKLFAPSRKLLSILNMGTAVYTPTANGQDFLVVDINPIGEALSHVKWEDVVGQRLTHAFPGVIEFGLFEILQRVLRTGESEEMPPTEYIDNTRTGWFSNHVVRLEPDFVMAVYVDVTQKMEAQEQLQDSEQRYRMLAESTLDGIYEWNVETDELYLSPAWKQQLGYKDHELPNAFSTWVDHLDEGDKDRVLTHLQEFLQAPDKLWNERFRLRHRDGHKVQMLTRAVPHFDTEGKLKRLHGVHIDIDQLARTETKLAKRVKELTCLQTVHHIILESQSLEETCLAIVNELTSGMQFPKRARPCIELDGRIYPNNSCLPSSKDTALYAPITVHGMQRGAVHVGYTQPVRSFLPEEQKLVDSVSEALRLMLQRESAIERFQLLERVLATTSDLISVVDTSYIYRIVNDAYAHNWGISRNEIEGKSVPELLGQETFEQLVKPKLDRCFAGEQVSYQAYFTYVEGQRYVDILYVPLRDSQHDIYGAVVSVRDITPLHDAQQKVRQAARVFESTVEGVIITDPNGTILDVNDAFTKITGYRRGEVIHRNPSILKSGRHDASFYKSMWRTLLKEGSWRGEIWNRRKGGDIYPERLTISSVESDYGVSSGFVGVFSDITAEKQAANRLEHLAHHDPLTQLPNRMMFEHRLRQSVSLARRRSSRFAVIFIDIDRFKHVNDNLGHAAGDMLLRQIAERLKHSVRIEDTVARISGDEFVVMIENLDSTKQATSVAEKLIAAFVPPFQLDQHALHISCSIGVSLFPEDGMEASTLLRNADAAMYQAKELGRNNYQFYTREMTDAAMEQIFLENALRIAIKQKELYLEYQPQVSLDNQAVVGVEALLRWKHPERGQVPPSRFIPVAEQTGLIQSIGTWVLHQACQQASQWLKEGLPFGRMAVNVSGNQLQNEQFAATVNRILDNYNLPPEYLELEVTESYLLDNQQTSQTQITTLRNHNIDVAIDDFGTGYSSLSYLQRLMFAKLKIDRSFITDLSTEANDRAICEAVIALGKALNLQVIAEGVETEEQSQFLRSKGCTLAQGFLYSKPLLPEQLISFLTPCSTSKSF